MAHIDSIDKIVTSYFACVTAEPFTYKGKEYEPKLLRVSPLLFRGYTCPPHCGACCSRFSLDYLPREKKPKGLKLKRREIEFNDWAIPIFSDMQTDHDNHHCRNLSMVDGRCGIHGRHPFSCDFELIRFMTFEDNDDKNQLTQKLYGRAHAMLRIDGGRGAQCSMIVDEKAVKEVIRKLKRLRSWCEHFNLKHKVTAIINRAEDLQGGKPPKMEWAF